VGTEDNKAVVRRFIEDVVTGRDVDVADDEPPGYGNVAMEGVDITGLKAITTGLRAAVGEVRIGDSSWWPRGMRSSPGSTTASPSRTGASGRHASLRTTISPAAGLP
jgi:hypothetical protein